MNLLNTFTLNLFLDILPDGTLSTLSTNFKLINNLIYYDEDSTKKINIYLYNRSIFHHHEMTEKVEETLNNQISDLQQYFKLNQLQGPYKIQSLQLYEKVDGGKINLSNYINNHKLSKIYLLRTILNNDIIMSIAKLISNNTLNYLYINENDNWNNQTLNENINLVPIFKSLKNNNSLEYLYLSNVYIGNIGGEMLMISMKDNKKLKVLLLVNNDISNNNIFKILGDSLKNNNILEELSIWENNIDDNGAIAIANVLKNSNITHISLMRNQIGDDGAKAIIDNRNNSIQYIDLQNNNISTEATVYILNTVRNKPDLLNIDIDVGDDVIYSHQDKRYYTRNTMNEFYENSDYW